MYVDFFFKEIFKELKWNLVGVEYSKACTCACMCYTVYRNMGP